MNSYLKFSYKLFLIKTTVFSDFELFTSKLDIKLLSKK